ncbi:MAG: enoyl-CoA hydratase/isomerase family protein [Desulfobacterales bacterium]|nr:enoyl-CoA hydratase/isomerase family protein [Desulfobacterales bacterium]
MSEFVEFKQKGAIAEIILNRPEAYNAFNYEMVVHLVNHLTAAASEDKVRGVVITGNGKAFCAGGDLRWVLGYSGPPSSAFHKLAGQFHLAVLEIRRMPKPVIAAINGVAAGGGFSLALSCDFRVMASSAVLRQAYTSSGLCIDGGGSFALPRLVGFARAMEILAFDEPISSSQALEWGLVTNVTDDDQTLAAAHRMASEIAGRSIHSFALSKKLIMDAFTTSFETQIENERAALEASAGHEDGLEGLRAFAEKRQPNYS